MANELRWILAAICVPVLVAIWWWTARRSRQAAPGDAEMRESAAAVAVTHAEPAAQAEHTLGAPTGSSDWGVPPFEPLSIRTADFEEVQILDLPMSAHAADPLEEAVTAPSVASMAPTPTAPAQPTASAGPGAAAPGESAPGETAAAVTSQRIVTVRVCALGESQWSGVDLMTALDNHGLAHGRYQVFHRKHSDGRTLFCAASLVEPGTFDIARMPAEMYRGLTLFAVLPGPADSLQTVDALIEAARGLAQTLHGSVQDSKGVPLSAEQVEALREDAALFS